MGPCHNRRMFLRAAGASVLLPLIDSPLRAATAKPSTPVAIARCKSYDPEAVLRQLQAIMDQLGGLGKLVAGKTVAVKVNLVGNVRQNAARQGREPDLPGPPVGRPGHRRVARPGRGPSHPVPGEHPSDRAVRSVPPRRGLGPQ